MNASEVLGRSGLQVGELLEAIRPVRPESVSVKTAPALMRRLWGQGIQAMTLGYNVYVDPRVIAGPARRFGLLMAHELVHVRQWREQGLFGFSGRYLTGYLHGRRERLGHRGAYLQIEQELEARAIASRVAELS
jgi:Domain of unknown function (DUF4157)